MGESTKTVLDTVFQRKRWCISHQHPRPEHRGIDGVSPARDWKPVPRECCAQGHKKMEVSAQLESGLILLLLFCACFRPSIDLWCPFTLVKVGLLLLSTNSNGNLVQKYQIIRSYTINSYIIIAPVIWTYLSLVKLTYKINHHKEQVEINETEKMIETINGTRDCFFEKVSNIDKTLARMIRETMREAQRPRSGMRERWYYYKYCRH